MVKKIYSFAACLSLAFIDSVLSFVEKKVPKKATRHLCTAKWRERLDIAVELL